MITKDSIHCRKQVTLINLNFMKRGMKMKYTVELFKTRKFYEKYKDTYFSDIILRNVFNQEVSLHKVCGIGKKSYQEIHALSTELIREIIANAKEDNIDDKEQIGMMIHQVYIDPDSKGIKERESVGVLCSADGLLSISRIYQKYGIDDRTADEYEHYRKVPIFFFPSEKNGINTSRASLFGDRIDHTLYDIKMYFEARNNEKENNCKLLTTRKLEILPETKKWLDSFNSFNELVEWYGIKGIFVNDDYDVYDLEKGEGNIIEKYRDSYGWKWSDAYYENLKKCIDQFMKKHHNQEVSR